MTVFSVRRPTYKLVCSCISGNEQWCLNFNIYLSLLVLDIMYFCFTVYFLSLNRPKNNSYVCAHTGIPNSQQLKNDTARPALAKVAWTHRLQDRCAGLPLSAWSGAAVLVGLLRARRGHKPSSSPVVIVITSGCQTNKTQYRRRPCLPSDRQSLLEHSSWFRHLCFISLCIPVTPQITLVWTVIPGWQLLTLTSCAYTGQSDSRLAVFNHRRL